MNTKLSPKERFLSFKKTYEECVNKRAFERGFLLRAIQLNVDICWMRLTDELQHKFNVFHDVIAAYRLIGSEVNFQDLYGYEDEVNFDYEYCTYSNSELECVMDKVLSAYDKATENDKSWFGVEFGDVDGLSAKIDETVKFIRGTFTGDLFVSPDLITKLFKEYT